MIRSRPLQATGPLNSSHPKSTQSTQLSTQAIIILASVGVAILIIAAVLGIFWNKIFGA